MSRLEVSCNPIANNSKDLVAILALPPIKRGTATSSLQALSLIVYERYGGPLRPVSRAADAAAFMPQARDEV
jgi:hypothetical protein